MSMVLIISNQVVWINESMNLDVNEEISGGFAIVITQNGGTKS